MAFATMSLSPEHVEGVHAMALAGIGSGQIIQWIETYGAQLFTWIVQYGLPLLLQLLPLIAPFLSAGGTLSTAVGWVESGLAELKAAGWVPGQPLPSLPTLPTV
jgi:hypothetical protein